MYNERKGHAVIFTDASYNRHKKVASIGFVIKKEGKILKEYSRFFRNVKDNHYAEAIAIKTGIVDAIYETMASTIAIFTDSLGIYEQYKKWKSNEFSKIENELLEAIYFAGMEGMKVEINYVKGHSKSKLNNKAHDLAKQELNKNITNRL